MLIKIIPNLLCIFRIFSAFVSVGLLHSNTSTTLVVGLVLLGAMSDFFDGYIARKFNVESRIGALLDPLADKIFANLLLWGIWLKTPNCILFIITVFLSVRDLLLIVGSLFVVRKHLNVTLKPLFISKICTSFVFVYIITSLLFLPENKYVYYTGIFSLGLIIITSVAYIIRYFISQKKQ